MDRLVKYQVFTSPHPWTVNYVSPFQRLYNFALQACDTLFPPNHTRQNKEGLILQSSILFKIKRK